MELLAMFQVEFTTPLVVELPALKKSSEKLKVTWNMKTLTSKSRTHDTEEKCQERWRKHGQVLSVYYRVISSACCLRFSFIFKASPHPPFILSRTTFLSFSSTWYCCQKTHAMWFVIFFLYYILFFWWWTEMPQTPSKASRIRHAVSPKVGAF